MVLGVVYMGIVTLLHEFRISPVFDIRFNCFGSREDCIG